MAKRRPNGDGAVRKRADGRWEGQIVVGHKEDGSPIFKSVFGKTQKELMPKLHAAIDEYRDIELTEDSRITLGEWSERWLENMRYLQSEKIQSGDTNSTSNTSCRYSATSLSVRLQLLTYRKCIIS